MLGGLRSDLWVRAYLRRLELANIPAYVLRRGQPEAGMVLVKCAQLDGTAQAWERRYDPLRDAHSWMVLKAGPELEVDESLRRQVGFDPDLWLVEIESRDGRTLLDEPGLD